MTPEQFYSNAETAGAVARIGSVLPQFIQKGTTTADYLNGASELYEDHFTVRRYEILNVIGATHTGDTYRILLRKPWRDIDLIFSVQSMAFPLNEFSFAWTGGKITGRIEGDAVFCGGMKSALSFFFYPQIGNGLLEIEPFSFRSDRTKYAYHLDENGEIIEKNTVSTQGYGISRFVYRKQENLADITFCGPNSKTAVFVLPTIITQLNLPPR